MLDVRENKLDHDSVLIISKLKLLQCLKIQNLDLRQLSLVFGIQSLIELEIDSISKYQLKKGGLSIVSLCVQDLGVIFDDKSSEFTWLPQLKSLNEKQLNIKKQKDIDATKSYKH